MSSKKSTDKKKSRFQFVSLSQETSDIFIISYKTKGREFTTRVSKKNLTASRDNEFHVFLLSCINKYSAINNKNSSLNKKNSSIN